MIRVTLDVNVLASGFPAEAGPTAQVIERWTTFAYELVISEHILSGLARAWQKPYYRSRYSEAQVLEALRLLRAEAELVEPVTDVHHVSED